jgi:hypothetical protein
MREKVTISYRGAAYEIGRGRDSYAVWAVGAPRGEPVERWPDTPEGWVAAWTRFTGIETPGTIVPAARGFVIPGMRGAAVPGPASLQEHSAATPGTAGTAVLPPPPAPDAGPVTVPIAGTPAGATAPIGTTLAGVTRIGAGSVLAAGLLAAGVLLSVVSLFPSYLSGVSLSAQGAAEWVPHVAYLVGWALGAVLVLYGAARRRAGVLAAGALLSAGLSVVTFGLYLADLGTVIADGAHAAGTGLWLGLAGWLAAAAGSAVAVVLMRKAGRPLALRKPSAVEMGPVVIMILAGLGAAVAFAPAWDSFVLRTAAGQSETITAGNAFANPGAVIAGNVAVMVAFGLTVIAATLWRRTRLGVALLAGAVIPMAAQVASALFGVSALASPQQFGVSPAQASAAGLTISSGLTAAFWLYAACVLVLVVSCAWLLFAASPAARARFAPADVFPAEYGGFAPGPAPARSGQPYAAWEPLAWTDAPAASTAADPTDTEAAGTGSAGAGAADAEAQNPVNEGPAPS